MVLLGGFAVRIVLAARSRYDEAAKAKSDCCGRANGARQLAESDSDRADVAQSVEHSLGKGEVTGSIPVISSRISDIAGYQARLPRSDAGKPAFMFEADAERLIKPSSGSNSVVESQPSKLLVAGSIPVSRSRLVPMFLMQEPKAGPCLSNQSCRSQDEKTFGEVKRPIKQPVRLAKVDGISEAVERAKLRVRDLKVVGPRGLLGKRPRAVYRAWRLRPGTDPRVVTSAWWSRWDRELRAKYLKVYAYY